MTAKRERAVVAQTKVHTAQRLIDEAWRELQGALPAGHRLIDEASETLIAVRRLDVLIVQMLKRIP